MPEGHSVHRIARQFEANFVGRVTEVTSPQGRFADGAALISGTRMVRATAVGKQMFLQFENQLWLRVHLGIYGAWDFSGEVLVHPSIQVHGVTAASGQQAASGARRFGQTQMAGVVAPIDGEAEDSVTSIGAPRRARVRMAENDKTGDVGSLWPPPPVGQVRARLLTETVCADLRGPTACEVLTEAELQGVLNRLGPDPANDASQAAAERFIKRAAKKPTPIGLVLMDQAIIAGIGNVYRAEMLFRAALDPHTPANQLPRETLQNLWDDWVHLLETGISVGQMITKDGLTGSAYALALRDRDARHWVYKKEGTACERCGAEIQLEEFGKRKLYWCPGCQH
ncbi:Fpg/Nei family DNA glycosylase [Canibacter zhoujuaniae]|uniref:Fpg/Nei family DNA glycosylase n=1 Tax=Canibacter zhoujuaniae TaxID=2708343 RepID=UPI00141ECC9A|nr:DNA-formamidopyrimidine glycosylase family protein [Canibacter zhoujuaniae]